MPRRATANEAPRTENSHRRILFVAIALALWMLAIGARLVQLQIHQHDEPGLPGPKSTTKFNRNCADAGTGSRSARS